MRFGAMCRLEPRTGLRQGLPVVLACLAMFLADPGTVLADDTSAGRDVDGIYPVQSVDVEMVEEDVTIELFTPEGVTSLPGLYSRARCEFVFRNKTAGPLDVLMAFPAEPAAAENPDYGDPVVRDFKSLVGDRELPVTLEPASSQVASGLGSYSSWYTFTVHFGPGEQVSVVNTYWVKNTSNSIGEVFVRYVLETGRYWSGPIGRATVTVKLGDVGPWYVDNLYPGNWRFAPDGHSLVWHRENFEPVYNLAVRYCIREWERGGTRPERKADFEKLIVDGPTLTREALLEAYDEAVVAGDPVKAALVRAFLPGDAVPQEPPVLTKVEVKPPQDSVSLPLLHIEYADRDGDLVILRLKVTHQEQGATVVDYDTVETDRWIYQSAYSGSYQAYLGNQPPYQIEVSLEDAADLAAAKSLTYAGPGTCGGPGGGQPAAGTQTPAEVPLGRRFPAWWVGGLALVVALAVGVVLFRRRHAV